MSSQTAEGPPDYLIIGHITQDQGQDGYRLGGTAIYSGLLAHRMGLKVAIYTSGASHLDLDIMGGIEIIDQPGSGTTTFINEYTAAGRVQRLLDLAEQLDLNQIPERWKAARVIHLAPVAGELPLTAGNFFPDRFLGYSLQGWLRTWDQDGWVSPAPFPELRAPIPENALGILSIEDLGDDRSGLERLQRQFHTLVLTLGTQGAEIFAPGRTQLVPAPPAAAIDPTGAGDIFAAALLTMWRIRGMPLEDSVGLANAMAAASISQPGIAGIPEKQEINQIIKVQR